MWTITGTKPIEFEEKGVTAMQNDMRDRLVELKINFVENFHCGDCQPENDKCKKCLTEKEADYLLANGVIAPPCKVGDIVWKIEDVWHLDDKKTWTYHYEKEVVEFMVRSISISCNSKGIWTKKFRICEVREGKVIDNQHNIEFEDFGRTVFSVREEAEMVLKEGADNG